MERHSYSWVSSEGDPEEQGQSDRYDHIYEGRRPLKFIVQPRQKGFGGVRSRNWVSRPLSIAPVGLNGRPAAEKALPKCRLLANAQWSHPGCIGPVPGRYVAPTAPYAVLEDSFRFSGIEWSILELYWTLLNISRVEWSPVETSGVPWICGNQK